jgi:2-(1,2-epoxy-1,2-dihydrophenyl)acetyl-CoA isomerase
MDEPVLVERAGGVHTLTLNRPDKINALNEAVFEGLQAALSAAEGDRECRAILLAGAGRGFCSGADLTGNAGLSDDLGAALERSYNPLVRRMRALPLPIVCAVHGVAAGAGFNLALACDIVVAGRGARLTQAFVRIGLIPDAGGTWFLPRLAGDARARGLGMLGDEITGEQAAAWGLIWAAVEDGHELAEGERIAGQLAQRPTQAIALMKQAFLAAPAATLDAQLDLERDLQRTAGRTPDFHEGVAAFREKRPARFIGRPA